MIYSPRITFLSKLEVQQILSRLGNRSQASWGMGEWTHKNLVAVTWCINPRKSPPAVPQNLKGGFVFGFFCIIPNSQQLSTFFLCSVFGEISVTGWVLLGNLKRFWVPKPCLGSNLSELPEGNISKGHLTCVLPLFQSEDSAARENFLCILQKYVNSQEKSLRPTAGTVIICMSHKQVVRNRPTENYFWEILTQMSSPQPLHVTEENTERKQLHSGNEWF